VRTREQIEKALIRSKPWWYKITVAEWRQRVQRAVAVELLLDIRDLLIELKENAEGRR
jgi:hypothetical protein